ncbi:putative siderophore biosynthesis protein SbnA [compost metagenome]
MLSNTIIDAIGRTPLVKLRLDSKACGEVYAKLEMMNPYGMKDRVGKQMVLEAKRRGVLKDGAPIIESSSGTMALGLAVVGTYLGHEVCIVTDKRTDELTLTKLRALGCRVEVVTEMTHSGWQSARLDRLAQLLAENPDAFCPRQYENKDNPIAYETLAKEVIDDIGPVDILVGSVGSGGSLCGTARALKRWNDKLRVVGVDAVGSVIFDQFDIPGRLQNGLGNSVVPKNVDHQIIDEVHWTNDEEGFAATLKLASEEKIFAGNSAGSVYWVSRWLSTQVESGTKILAIFPDRGDRYYKNVYNPEFRAEKGLQGLTLPIEPAFIEYGVQAKEWSYAFLHHDREWSGAGSLPQMVST